MCMYVSFICVLVYFFRYHRRDRLDAHRITFHGTAKLFICNMCGSSLSRKDQLTIHQKYCADRLSGTVRSFECETCMKKFKTKKTLSEHVRVVHVYEQGKYSCKRCGKIFRWRSGLFAHRQKPNCGHFGGA